MTLAYNEQKIRSILRDFYNATGIDINLLRSDFSEVCAQQHQNRYCSHIHTSAAGKKACVRADRELLNKCRDTHTVQTHICHAGLVDVAIPIVYEDSIIGYILFGRMKPATDFSALKRYICSLGLDSEEAAAAYAQIPFFDEDRIRSVSAIATMLVEYILLEQLLHPARSNAEKVAAYISENLSQELSIATISQGTNISKSVLYKDFQLRYGCTPGAYINRKRVERSMELLQKTDLSIEEISQQVGFSSASHYSKTFKKQEGKSPLQFRKANSRR